LTESDPAQDAARDALVDELEQRIDEFEKLDEGAFGNFTTIDWVICVLGALVVPYIVVWVFAQ